MNYRDASETTGILARWDQACAYETTARAQFSEYQRRLVGYRQKWKCVGEYCQGRELLPAEFQIDHRIPLHQSGTNDLSNLQALCGKCHARKTAMERSEFFARERAHKFQGVKPFVPAEKFYAPVSDAFTATTSGYFNKDE